jgi:hypothetical protein
MQAAQIGFAVVVPGVFKGASVDMRYRVLTGIVLAIPDVVPSLSRATHESRFTLRILNLDLLRKLWEWKS